MSVYIPPGVFDILPYDKKEGWRASYLWKEVEEVIRTLAKLYGYQEIRTPIFERTELFARGVGATSDIVSKEMYTFVDKGKRSMSLRPEGTAPVMRAFIEHHMEQQTSLQKLFYIGPMFRYERSQSGRYRQHHQFGVEAIGLKGPEQDAEVIDLLVALCDRLGLKNLLLQINSLGDLDSRRRYRAHLKEYLKQYMGDLSEDSRTRFETNPLRILDSKDPKDQEIVQGAPSILDFLSPDCRHHFDEVQSCLDQLEIPFEVNPKLVRGLDYYNNTVFEMISPELGAQNSIGGGGRYDGLMKSLGGRDLPAIGFGAGIERIIQTMLKQQVSAFSPDCPLLYFIPLGEEAKKICFSLVHKFRKEGLPVQLDLSRRKLSKAIQFADHLGAHFVAVVGEDELKSEQVELKEMKTGKTMKAPLFHLSRILRIEMQTDDFIKLWGEMLTPFEQSSQADFFINKLSNAITQTSQVFQNLKEGMEQMGEILQQTTCETTEGSES